MRLVKALFRGVAPPPGGHQVHIHIYVNRFSVTSQKSTVIPPAFLYCHINQSKKNIKKNLYSDKYRCQWNVSVSLFSRINLPYRLEDQPLSTSQNVLLRTPKVNQLTITDLRFEHQWFKQTRELLMNANFFNRQKITHYKRAQLCWQKILIHTAKG